MASLKGSIGKAQLEAYIKANHAPKKPKEEAKKK